MVTSVSSKLIIYVNEDDELIIRNILRAHYYLGGKVYLLKISQKNLLVVTS